MKAFSWIKLIPVLIHLNTPSHGLLCHPHHLWARESFEDWHYFNLSLLPRSIDRENRARSRWYLIGQAQNSCIASSRLWWRYLRSEWQTIQSLFSYTLRLLPSLPYPLNTITKTDIHLETSWFLDFLPKFSILI